MNPAGRSDFNRVIQFEAPTTDWSKRDYGQGTLGTSATASQGNASLSIQPRGYVLMQSVPLAAGG